jgi:hypothetical protein
VSRARSLLTWGRRRFGRGFGSFRSSFRGSQNLCSVTVSTEGGFGEERGKGLGVGKFLLFTSALTEIV